MHRRTAVLSLALALAAGAVAAWSGPATADPRTALQAKLTGAAEVPGPGDADGGGNGVVKVDAVSGEICVVVTAHRVAPLTAGHIHEAASTASGPVVLALTQTGPGKFQGCATNAALAADLVDAPQDYYLNVHNAEFPGGALRGQLG